MIAAATAHRVSANTSDEINEWIRQQTEANIARYSSAGPAKISHRLAELDQEWDVERCLETLAPTFTLIGMTLGLTVNRKWFALPFVVQAFFLQHAIQGWCPPLPFLRRMGIRTMEEIEHERNALKAARGDFRGISAPPGQVASQHAGKALEAARK